MELRWFALITNNSYIYISISRCGVLPWKASDLQASIADSKAHSSYSTLGSLQCGYKCLQKYCLAFSIALSGLCWYHSADYSPTGSRSADKGDAGRRIHSLITIEYCPRLCQSSHLPEADSTTGEWGIVQTAIFQTWYALMIFTNIADWTIGEGSRSGAFNVSVDWNFQGPNTTRRSRCLPGKDKQIAVLVSCKLVLLSNKQLKDPMWISIKYVWTIETQLVCTSRNHFTEPLIFSSPRLR